jgi:hypothetical protein
MIAYDFHIELCFLELLKIPTNYGLTRLLHWECISFFKSKNFEK